MVTQSESGESSTSQNHSRTSAPPITALHILTLSGFALAQPLFDILGKHPEFFVARRSPTVDIWLFIIIVALGVPGAIVLVEWLIVRTGQRFSVAWRSLVRAAIITALVSLIALPMLKRIGGLNDGTVVLLAVLGGISAALSYRLLPVIRRFLTILSPAVAIFPLLFILTPGITDYLFTAQSTNPTENDRSDNAPDAATGIAPVIFVVFDELPSTSLMTSTGAIDDQRFTNFAALANESHWFRNASTVSDNTLWALPAILSGTKPEAGAFATSTQHPDNLFTWLQSSHRLNVTEQVTDLCPEALCPDQPQPGDAATRLKGLASDLSVVYQHHIFPESFTASLPAIDYNWKNFDRGAKAGPLDSKQVVRYITSKVHQNRKQKFENFIKSIQPDAQPALHFFHSLLPHSPYDYLPSGKIYGVANDLPGIDNGRWTGDTWSIDRNYLRHLMQVQFVDHLLGKLLAHLKAVDLYDRSLIVVVADHGVSFEHGTSIRLLSNENSHDIMPVPFILKLPHQSNGIIHDDNVSLLDVVPTVAEGLNLTLPWKTDGQSALNKNLIRDAQKTIAHKRGHESLTIPMAELIARRQIVIEHKEQLLSDAERTPGLLAQHRFARFIGQPISAAHVTTESDAVAVFEHQSFYENADPDSHFLPVRVRAQLQLGQSKRPDYVAVAINDTLWAIDKPVEILDDIAHLRSFVPDTAFNAGHNEATAWLVYKQGSDEYTFSKTNTQRRQTSGLQLKKNWFGQVSGLVDTNGEILPLGTTQWDGWLDQIRLQEGVVMFSGWAASKDRSNAVARVALFVDGSFLLAATPNVARDDVRLAQRNGKSQFAGFSYHIPLSNIPSGVSEDVRAFAISEQGELFELKYGNNFQWSRR